MRTGAKGYHEHWSFRPGLIQGSSREPARPMNSGPSARDRPSADRASRRSRHWPLGLLLLIPIGVLWRALFLGEAFFYQDLSAQYVPRERLLMHAAGSGWNPHIFLGMSLAGDPQS